MNTVTVTITLPLNATPLERAQALVAASYQNGGLGAVALGELLGDLRAIRVYPACETTFIPVGGVPR